MSRKNQPHRKLKRMKSALEHKRQTLALYPPEHKPFGLKDEVRRLESRIEDMEMNFGREMTR